MLGSDEIWNFKWNLKDSGIIHHFFRAPPSTPNRPGDFCQSVGSNLMRGKAWEMRASVAAAATVSLPCPPRSQHPSQSISPQPFVGPLCLPVRPTPSVTLHKRAFVCHFPLLPLDVDDKRRRSSCQPKPHATNRTNKYWLKKKYQKIYMSRGRVCMTRTQRRCLPLTAACIWVSDLLKNFNIFLTFLLCTKWLVRVAQLPACIFGMSPFINNIINNVVNH